MTTPTLGPLKVLVVDDDEDIAAIVADAFARAGCHVETAPSGRKAEVAIAARPFDVLLTDIRMPDGDGIGLLEWVARTKRTLAPFVMTGFADVSMEKALRLGALGFFGKPLDLDLLVDTVMRKAVR